MALMAARVRANAALLSLPDSAASVAHATEAADAVDKLPARRLRTIGEALNTTEETAKNTLFRATQKLRAALADLK